MPDAKETIRTQYRQPIDTEVPLPFSSLPKAARLMPHRSTKQTLDVYL